METRKTSQGVRLSLSSRLTYLALFVLKKITNVTCQNLHVICHVSHVTFHMSLTPTATDLPPSAIIHSKLIPDPNQN